MFQEFNSLLPIFFNTSIIPNKQTRTSFMQNTTSYNHQPHHMACLALRFHYAKQFADFFPARKRIKSDDWQKLKRSPQQHRDRWWCRYDLSLPGSCWSFTLATDCRCQFQTEWLEGDRVTGNVSPFSLKFPPGRKSGES